MIHFYLQLTLYTTYIYTYIQPRILSLTLSPLLVLSESSLKYLTAFSSCPHITLKFIVPEINLFLPQQYHFPPFPSISVNESQSLKTQTFFDPFFSPLWKENIQMEEQRILESTVSGIVLFLFLSNCMSLSYYTISELKFPCCKNRNSSQLPCKIFIRFKHNVYKALNRQ